MKTTVRFSPLLTSLLTALTLLTDLNSQLSAASLGTTFTYQGRLTVGASVANGNYDLRFFLYDADVGGSLVGPILTNAAVLVSGGQFTVPLDFGSGVFTGDARWLEIGVRTSGGGNFTTLSPRQALRASPYALYALTPAGPVGPQGPMGPQGPVGSADAWSRTGNAGTNPDLNFIGTTDTAALVIRAGNQNVMRLEGQPSGVRIIAGWGNTITSTSTNSGILGGRNGLIEGNAPESTIVGGVDNAIRLDQRSAFIGGGARNEILQDNQHGVIVGGRDNRIGTNTLISLVVGGAENRINNNVDGGLMVGGFRNDILGSPNPNRREIAPVLIGGSDNEIGFESSWASILGGDNNRIGTNCPSAVIAGGTNNVAANNAGYSFAAGTRCRVNHAGAFVWADSQNASFASQDVDTFNIRAAGGVHLSPNTSQFFGSATRQMVNLWGTAYGLGVQSSTLYQRSGGDFSWFRGGVHSDTRNAPGTGGVEAMRLTSGGLTVNGTFVSASDRNIKEDFEPVNSGDVLDKVLALALARWSYKADEERSRHLGPMAQDFHSAFGLGADDKHIAAVDADGVALAAIQGLNQKLEETVKAKDAEIQALRQSVAELKAVVGTLAEKVNGGGR
jgi:trimeric autotransporter adhesin